MAETHPIVAALTLQLGDHAVLTDAAMGTHPNDFRGVSVGEPIAVVLPKSTTEVAEVVAACVEHRVAIVPQGGNTGLSAGATLTATVPHVLMSLTRMNAIEDVNPDQWTMTVQAGATIQSMHEAAADTDRLFAPDWGARGTATIGGAIATDAGGINVLRYGNMRDQILGIEVVLGDGTVWDGMRALRKDSSGYDLKHLFIGSEGTLGIVTRAVVKLHPATKNQQSALAALADLDQLMTFFALVNEQAPGMVTAFELMPDIGIERVCEVYDIARPIDSRTEFYVLMKLASSRPVDDNVTGLLAEAADRGLIVDAVVAATPAQEEQLWFIRDEVSPLRIYADTQSVGLKMDTAVPLDLIGEYHNAVRAIGAEIAPDALTYGFGHVGDGNLHMMVLPLTVEEIPAFVEVKPELERRIDEVTFALGGTLSAEHGIGRALRDRVGPQKPAVEWDMMRAVKAAIDPAGIMNPGAVIPDQ